MTLRTCTIGLVLGALGTMVGAQTIAPGNYVYEGGYGHLSIEKDRSFVISTFGGNGHICDLDGTLVGSQSTAKGNKCVLTFKAIGSNLQLDTNGDQDCRQYCGARAGFEGRYIKPEPACTPDAIAKARREFKNRYDRKSYIPAVQTLAPLLSKCTKVLNRFEENWIRNDLALAQLRSGDKSACLTTLAPLVELATMTDEDIRGIPEPTYVSNHLDIAKAARTNLRLCGRMKE